MQLLWIVLRWGLFFCSLCGWFSLVSRIPRIHSSFLPIVTLSSLTVTVFTFGMVHLLRPISLIVFIGGLISFVYHLRCARQKRFSFAFLRSPGMLFFTVASALCIFLLYGVSLYHYDNFSHWGTVLAEMFSFNDFPTAQTIVVFRDYAPGTTSFLYLFGSVVGQSEDVALMAQAMLSFAALTALFFSVKRVRSMHFWAMVLLSLCLTCALVFDDGTLQIFNLLVDAIIGFTVASAWCIREKYRETPLLGWLLVTPVLVFLVLIKMNAAVFLIFFAFFFAYDALKSLRTRYLRLFCLLPVALPLLWIFLWRLYRQITYGTPADSYGYTGFWDQIFSQSPDFFLSVIRLAFRKITNFSQIYAYGFLGVNTVLCGSWCVLRWRKKDTGRLGKSILTVNILMVGYFLCMIFLYCFIMTPEASTLAAFERYMVTPFIVFAAIGMESLFRTLAGEEGKPVAPSWVILFLSVVISLLTAKNAVQLVRRPDFSTFERGQVMDVLREAAPSIPRNSAVALYNGSRGRRDLYYYLTMYEVKSRWVFVLDLGHPQYSVPIDVNMLQTYHYLVISADATPLREALVDAGFVLRWKPGCTLYRIARDEFDRMVIFPADEE